MLRYKVLDSLFFEQHVILHLQKVKEFCPHHVGHYLGMDVHDTTTVSRNMKLLPGMVVTSEPGMTKLSTSPNAIKCFSCSTQLSMKFILLILKCQELLAFEHF